LLEGKKGTITAEDLFLVLRDRYQGTDKFTKPLDTENWREHSEEKNIPRTISSNLGQSSSVAVLRKNMPLEVGAMMWYAMVSPEYSGYFPVYAGANLIPNEINNNKSDNNSSSAWWTFKSLQSSGNKNYEKFAPLINNFWTTNHQSITQQQNTLESKVVDLLNNNKKHAAIKLLNTFTNSQAETTLYHAKRWLNLINK